MKRYPHLLEDVKRLRQERQGAAAAYWQRMTPAGRRHLYLRRRKLRREVIAQREPLPAYVDRLFASEVAALGLEPDERDGRRERMFSRALDALVDGQEQWMRGEV